MSTSIGAEFTLACKTRTPPETHQSAAIYAERVGRDVLQWLARCAQIYNNLRAENTLSVAESNSSSGSRKNAHRLKEVKNFINYASGERKLIPEEYF